MRQIAVVLGLCALLFPTPVWADKIVLITNQGGTVSITNAGIASAGSNIMEFSWGWHNAPPGHSLGSVSFSTGALVNGSLWGGGYFSSADSSFVALGAGQYGVPKGTIFSGSFVGPIYWSLVSQTGNDYSFVLTGNLTGMLFTGRIVNGAMTQTISVNQNQWNQGQQGSIQLGKGYFGRLDLRAGPEPGTLWTFATGLLIIAVAMRRKLFRA